MQSAANTECSPRVWVATIAIAALGLFGLGGCEEPIAPQLSLAGESDTAGADSISQQDTSGAGTADQSGGDAQDQDSPASEVAEDASNAEIDGSSADLPDEGPAAPDADPVDAADAAQGDAADSGSADATALDASDSSGDAPPGDGGFSDIGQPPALGPLSPCDSDLDCAGAASGAKCLVAAHFCVPCLVNGNCPSGAVCQGFQCAPAKACAANAGCPDVCDTAKGVCAQCVGDGDCPQGKACIQGGCMAEFCTATACGGAKLYACLGAKLGYGPGLTCEDGDPCTAGDGCAAGKCQPGPAKSCDDGNACTADSCSSSSGCVQLALQVGCDDGDACTQSDKCADGACQGLPKACDDGQECSKDFCLNGNCLASAFDGPCNDGNPCTQQDLCKNGKCTAGLLQCDDDNPCTEDSCGSSACVFVPKLGACDDGNACTLGDLCLSGLCTGVAKICIDANPCTDDGCVGGNCLFSPNNNPCNDGDLCTEADACSNGSCGGAGKSCDDSNPCTTDICFSTGCAHQEKSGPCDDGNGCTQGDVCIGASCVGSAKSCDDGSPCTQDKCEAGGCVYSPLDGGACGSGCNVCKGGQCLEDPNTGVEDSYGSNGADALKVILAAPGGGWLMAGKNPSNSAGGYDDGWVVRVDAKGNTLWEKYLGGAYHDSLRRGAVTSGGLYALVGTTQTANQAEQLWLVVVDDSGAVIVDVNLGAAGNDSGLAVAVNAAGLLVAGRKLVSGVGNAGYLVQVDAKGAILWEKTYANVSELVGVVPLGDQIAVVGPGPKADAGTDAVVMRLKPGGSVVWTSYVGSTFNDSPTDLALIGGGDLLVSGAQGGASGNRAMAARLAAADGKLAWQKTAVSAAGTTSIAQAAVQNGSQLVLAGQIVSNNQSDGLLWAIQPADGAAAWQRTVAASSSGAELLWGLYPRPAGGIAVVGELATPQANQDGWLLQLSASGLLGCSCEGSCTDNNACTSDSCLLGLCKTKPVAKSTVCADASNLPGKCDGYGTCAGVCGNKICEAGETKSNCSGDCK